MNRAVIQAMVDSLDEEASTASLFALAQSICGIAYREHNTAFEVSKDIAEVREAQWIARQKRSASAFEKLYCKLRDIADDFHREAIRRRDGLEKGSYDPRDCDPGACVESTFQLAYDRVADWDY